MVGKKGVSIVAKQTQYSSEFKAEIVRSVVDGGETVSDISKKYGINNHTVYGWVKKHRAATEPTAEVVEQGEVAELKRQLAEKDLELEFLKKAAAYFAKNRP